MKTTTHSKNKHQAHWYLFPKWRQNRIVQRITSKFTHLSCILSPFAGLYGATETLFHRCKPHLVTSSCLALVTRLMRVSFSIIGSKSVTTASCKICFRCSFQACDVRLSPSLKNNCWHSKRILSMDSFGNPTVTSMSFSSSAFWMRSHCSSSNALIGFLFIHFTPSNWWKASIALIPTGVGFVVTTAFIE